MKITINNIDDVFKSKIVGDETMEMKGYELIENLFVDSSGFGQEDEPALTIPKFKSELTRLINENGGAVYTVIREAGQFQVNLGVYKKTGKSKAKTISTNVLKIDTENGFIIRLYNTNIFEKQNDKIILNSGGYETATTKKWINKYLEPFNLYVEQKNWKWTVKSFLENTLIPFEDGMIINL